MKKTYLLIMRSLFFVLLFSSSTNALYAQVKEPFQVRYQNNIRGDLIYVANNIVNRNTQDYGINTQSYCDSSLSDNELPNTEYNTLGSTSLYNDCLYMQYIDIDGDPSTFSSSSANLTIPDISCSKVRYAGLYWAANYQYNIGDDSSSGRNNDFNQVKFKVPGGSYVDITADDVIFDGFGDSDFGATSPYACYTDVTNLVTALTNPEGNYYIANVRASEGFVDSGVSGGWTLIIVYENPSYPGKYISSFDGFAGIAPGNITDIDYNGFITLPNPFPVNAKFTIAALEGDNRITGDQLSIKANSNASFTVLGTSSAGQPNYVNNFFDSNITYNHVIQNNRNPNSINTLGYDTDEFDIPNAFNSVIPNDETGATLRASSTGDQYFVFMNALDVEIIEPRIILYKNVEDLGGNDIANQNLTLGQQFDYILGFENIGNDNATNYTIRDVFPVNTIFIEDQIQLPAGVTYVYDPVAHEITLTIPDYLIEAGDPLAEIRIRMQVVETCSELRDACSNIIQNTAYSTYRGVLNDNQITDDPSVSDFDVCGFPAPGSTNFLIGLDECDFVQTVALCGSSVDITAGSGYDTYVWRDSSGNIVGNTQTITVTSAGTYIVTKSGAAPCQSFDETVVVTNFSSTTTNPVIPYADEVVTCPNDGDLLPKIFLCGTNDNRFIQTDITNAAGMEWQVLDETSCAAVGTDDCANKDSGCNWITLSTDDFFDATTEGQYRIVVYYQNGCFSRFYFNVYENVLDPDYDARDIVCNTPGEIRVTNVPTGYEFQLVDQTTGTILVDYQTSPVFSINNPGTYTVNIQQINVGAGACIFSIPNIGIRARDFEVNTIVTDQKCNVLGSIRVQVLDVEPQYYYEISQNGITVDTYGPTNDNDYTFNNLTAGIYDVTVTTDDGCILTKQVEILNDSNLALTAYVSQNITCREGNILVHPSGGKPPYLFAIWTYNGTIYQSGVTDVTDLPASAFQSSNIFNIWDPGDYVFVVVDRNNCYAFSNEVTIILEPAVEYNMQHTDETCFGANDGTITINITDGHGYRIEFSLDGVTYRKSNEFTNLPPGTYTVLIKATKAGYECIYPEEITIAPAAELFGDAEISQDITCTALGEIRIVAGSVSGGTPPYQYSIDGVNFSANMVFGNLVDGTYVVTIRDGNGCTITTGPMTIGPLSPPTDLTFSASPITCPALTSDISVSIVGGTPPFTYEIIAPIANVVNNGSNNVFTGLGSGTYTFLVTDSKGCNITENYTINPISQIQVNGQLISNISCLGDTDGSIDYSVSGFVSTYTYSVLNSSSGTVSNGTSVNNSIVSLTNLAADTYTINVTDDVTNCTDSATIIVNKPPAALNFTFTATPIECNNTASTVVINASGGWGGYTYQLENTTTSTIVYPYQNSNVFIGLNSGNYQIYVQDANGCVLTQPTTINPYIGPTVTLSASTTCFDGADITLTANGSGSPPLQYSLNGGPWQSSNIFTANSPGAYTVTISDAYGCTAVSNAIAIGNQLIASSLVTKGLDCTASPDATIDITINGGLPNYTYEVSNDGGTTYTVIATTSSTSQTYSTATDGTFVFRISDAAGCTAITQATIEPLSPPNITSLVQTGNILCNGDNGASIQVNIDNTQGVPPFTITVINTTTSSNYGAQTAGLPAGAYEITVTDANSCTDVDTIVISEPDPIAYNITLVPITCDVSLGIQPGSITVSNLTGGTAEYTYYLTSNFGFTDQYTTTAGGEDHTFAILDFGIYIVDVVDTNGCSLRSTEIIASPPNDLDIDVSTATLDCVSGGTAIVTVLSALGSGSYEFGILDSNTFPYASSYQAPDVPGGSTATFTGLIPGVTYTFVVHDLTTNCYYFETAAAPIDSPSNLTSTLDVVNNVSCTGSADGTVSFTFDNYDVGATSVSYEIFNSQNNTTTGITGSQSVNPPTPGTGVSVSNLGPLPPGVYYILFIENGGANGGCTAGSSQFTVEESTNLLQVNLNLDKNDNCNLNGGQISAIGQYGTPPYEYQLTLSTDPAPTVSTWTGSPANVFNVEGSDYVIYIKDANNCIQSAPITVPTDPSPEISVAVTDQCASAEGGYSVEITLDVTGIPPYYISVDGGAPQSASGLVNVGDVITISGLTSGTHNFEITDYNGCGESEPITIYPPLNVNAQITAQPSCSIGGIITVNGIGGSGSYSFALLDSAYNPTGYVIVGSDFTNIPFGDYIIEITDTVTSCTATTPISLEEPTPVTYILNTGDVSCNGSNDGFIEVVLDPSNDNPPYTYTLDDGSSTISQSSPIFTGLIAGSYDITVTSGRDCFATQNIVITEPSSMNATASAPPFNCDTNNIINTSTLTISGVTGGTAPYLYSIDGISFFTGNTFTIIDTGADQTINYVVRDANACEFTDSIVINTLIPIIANLTVDSPISCANGETVTITASGGSGDFTFEVQPPGSMATQTGTSATFTLPLISDYTIRVYDNTSGCYVDVNHTVNPYPLMDVVSLATSNVSCFGDSTGEITVDVQNYSGNYDWTVYDDANNPVVNGSDSVAMFVISNLAAGIYTVEIVQTDDPFCTEISNAVTITSPDSAVNVMLNVSAPVSCNDDGGALTAIGLGGTTPYEYELVNNTTGTTVQVFGSNNNFENLSSGDYSIAIRDANGCTSTASQTLTLPIPISASITASSTMLLCAGDTTASISVISVTGGQGSYQYILNFDDGTTLGPQVSDTFNNIGAGTYSITVIDGLSCDFTTPTVTINEPSPVVASLIQLNGPTCLTDAALELSASGGTPPYQYSSNGITYTGSFNPSITIAPVGAGNYQYYVRDANGCEASISNQVAVDPVVPLAINLDITNAVINCTGDATAIIKAEATGGLGNYMYELLDSPTAITALQGPQSSGTFSDYPSGTYYVRVVSDDCVEISAPVTIVDPELLVIDSQSSTNISCLGQDDGTITVEASGGTGIIKYAITPNLDQFDTINTFTDLAPGTYEVIVQDENGCYIDLIFDIIEPAPISVSAITAITETCEGDTDGFIEVEITGGTPPYFTSLDTQDDDNYVQDQYTFSNLAGGTTYVIFVRDSGGCDTYVIVDLPQAANLDATLEIENFCENNGFSNSVTVVMSDPNVTNVTYALDNGAPQSSNVFTDLVSGDHFIDVIHPDGCMKTYDFNIQYYEPLTLMLEETNVNEITAIATGGAGGYEFYFNDDYTGSNNVYYINHTDNYTVRVVDALGCEAIANIQVEFVDICIPNFFTPDGDGNNDTWAPCNTAGFPNIVTKIYDRYGRVVAVLEKVEAWDGRYNGNELPTGDYWYVVQLNQSNDNREFVGHFTLYR